MCLAADDLTPQACYACEKPRIGRLERRRVHGLGADSITDSQMAWPIHRPRTAGRVAAGLGCCFSRHGRTGAAAVRSITCFQLCRGLLVWDLAVGIIKAGVIQELGGNRGRSDGPGLLRIVTVTPQPITSCSMWRSGEHLMGDEFTTRDPIRLRILAHGTGPIQRVDIIKDFVYAYTTEPKKDRVEFEWVDEEKAPPG